MKLKATYDTQDEIPEQYRDLYVLRDEKYHFEGVEGIKTEADLLRVRAALVKEQTAHKETKKKFQLFEGMDLDEVISQLDRIPELEAAAEKSDTSEAKIQSLVDAKIKTILAPIERESKQLKDKLATIEQENSQFKEEKRAATLEKAVLGAARELKVEPSMEDDVLRYCQAVCEVGEDGSVVTRDNTGVTPGIDPKSLIMDMIPKKPRWFQESVGAGLSGGKGSSSVANPWSKDNWNLTEQGRIFRENPTMAANLKKAAGIRE